MRQIASKIQKDYKGEIDSVYGIPRGGLVPAVYLSHLLKLPMNGFKPGGKNPIVIDDIADVEEVDCSAAIRISRQLGDRDRARFIEIVYYMCHVENAYIIAAVGVASVIGHETARVCRKCVEIQPVGCFGPPEVPLPPAETILRERDFKHVRHCRIKYC